MDNFCKIKIEPNFLSYEECDFLKSFAENNPSIFKDRRTFLPNYGMKRDLGNYVSCQFSRECFKDIFLKHLNIEFNGFPVKEVQLNKYEVGHFIPPHKDIQFSLHTVIVPLQDDSKNKLVTGDDSCYYDNISLEESDKQNRTK